MWLGQWSDRNHGRKVILPYDPSSLSPQYPAVPLPVIGPRIKPDLSEISRATE